MTLYFGRRGAVLLASALVGFAAPIKVFASAETDAPRSVRRRHNEMDTNIGSDYGWKKRGPGWTVAQVKRMAKKNDLAKPPGAALCDRSA